MDGENESMGAQPDQQRPPLRERIGKRAWVRSAALVGSGLIAGGVIAGTVTAVAADRTPPPGSSTSQEDGPRGDRHHGRGHCVGIGAPWKAHRHGEELLTREIATQVREAVLAEYPDATIVRVGIDSGGVYAAHIVTTEDERLTVLVDEDFEITGTEEHGD